MAFYFINDLEQLIRNSVSSDGKSLDLSKRILEYAKPLRSNKSSKNKNENTSMYPVSSPLQILPSWLVGQTSYLPPIIQNNADGSTFNDEDEYTGLSMDVFYYFVSALERLLPELKNIEYVDLSQNEITIYPDIISQFEKLHSLTLSNNQIGIIPADIGSLKQLELLDLSFNQIRELPPQIGQLVNLRTLDLSGNYLVVLPPEINEILELEQLNISNNAFSGIPKEIGKFTNLISLKI